jgi:hypothetical protein
MVAVPPCPMNSTRYPKVYSLRISNIVYGRQTNRNRVSYLVDPQGHGILRAVPETVVLQRWRQRVRPATQFSGVRLSSTLWRAVAATFPDASSQDVCSFTRDEVSVQIDAHRARLRTLYLRLPNADSLWALFQVLGLQRLRTLLERHNAPERMGHSGVPDLFLYAQDQFGAIADARFVEVKKPEEPVSEDQQAELDFMNSIGLRARVLRLAERARRDLLQGEVSPPPSELAKPVLSTSVSSTFHAGNSEPQILM